MMLDVKTINQLFVDLNLELARKNVIGEIGICGGAVMCLVFNARSATKDVDAIFKPSKEIRSAANKVAKNHLISDDWLNDAVKLFFHVDPPREDVLNLSHLRVWAPKADYMLAMKCISARFDSHDKDDVLFLINYLNLESKEKVFSIIEQYYPKKLIPPKTQFLIEEIMN